MPPSILFCPNKDCANHRHAPSSGWYRPYGWYRTKAYGKVRRHACRSCGTSFSRRTFKLSYYLHLTIGFREILYRLAACSGLRALAREYGVTDKVISNRIGRLARQAIGVTAGLRPWQGRSEPLAADGFESFIRSQYSPNNVHHLIGSDSQYVYASDLAHLRRKGRMTERQKLKRECLERLAPIPPGEIRRSFERICCGIGDLPWAQDGVVLHTDEKKEYRAALAALRSLEGKITHVTTSSRVPRTFDNPLWPVNYYDRELRKDQASQVRETTRQSREANNSMERMYAYAGYHNYFKPFRIKERDSRSHAEAAGFAAERVQSFRERFFRDRFFYTKVSFNASEWLVWLRAYHTPFTRAAGAEIPGYLTCRPRRSRSLPRAA